MYFQQTGTKSIKVKETGSSREPNRLGIKVANLLIQGGTIKLAEGWRDAVQSGTRDYDKKWESFHLWCRTR